MERIKSVPDAMVDVQIWLNSSQSSLAHSRAVS
jgi:hypothetical protein